MDNMKRKTELHQKGYNCGQIIAGLVSDKVGWDEEEACAGLSDMCYSCGEICGTLRGGDYCVNKYIREKTAAEHGIDVERIYEVLPAEDQIKMMRQAKAMSKQMYDMFLEKNGSLFCSELRTDNFMESCAVYVDDVVETLEKLIDAAG